MVLDGDVEQEQGFLLVPVLIFVDYLVIAGTVAGQAMLQPAMDVEPVHIDKLVKPQSGVGLVPLPGAVVTRVDRHAFVPVCIPQKGNQRGLLFVQILLAFFRNFSISCSCAWDRCRIGFCRKFSFAEP